jgi:cytoskeletal protein RodZ
MDKIPQPPSGKADSNMIVPVIAAVAITIALAFGWMMMSKGDQNQAGMTTQSSSTGASSGEAGQSTVQTNQNMRANPGAGAAPTKAPNTTQTTP